MRTYTEEQRQNHLRLQREWYHRNKEAVKIYKAEYHLKNKNAVNAKTKAYREKQKATKAIELSNERAKIKIPLSLILETLRPHKMHYLNSKDVFNWNEKDLAEFNKLLNG